MIYVELTRITEIDVAVNRRLVARLLTIYDHTNTVINRRQTNAKVTHAEQLNIV